VSSASQERNDLTAIMHFAIKVIGKRCKSACRRNSVRKPILFWERSGWICPPLFGFTSTRLFRPAASRSLWMPVILRSFPWAMTHKSAWMRLPLPGAKKEAVEMNLIDKYLTLLEQDILSGQFHAINIAD
jgi:hypothetical protein